MSYPQVLDAARALPRDEQLQLAQALLDPAAERPEPAPSDGLLTALFPPGQGNEIWSPYDATGAAEALQRLLDEAAGK